jgi:hypothetical protein
MSSVTVTVDIPRNLADDATRHWSGWTWNDVIGNALMLAIAWADHHPAPDNDGEAEVGTSAAVETVEPAA